MQRISKLIAAAFLAPFAFFSCIDGSKPTKEIQAMATPKPDTIHVEHISPEGAADFVVTEGVVNWLGKRKVGNRHTGTVQVKSGQLKVKQGRLLSGKITIDMNSITVENMKDPGAKADLESHLKHSDFFEVKKYPTAEFVFKEILPSKTPDFKWVITGDLTMKDTTNSVNIPVVDLTITDDELTAQTAPFVINRTKWGVNFQSGILGTVKNKIIEDIVPLSITLSAKKQR